MTPVVETELGLERRCNVCGEWWPLDAEFFYRQVNGHRGFQGICKACKSEQRGSGDTRRGRRVDDRLIRSMLAAGRSPLDIAQTVGVCLNSVLRRRAA